ncbi:MAG: hypothetical protein ACRENE_34445 [Polyangiaceae bacterium]
MASIAVGCSGPGSAGAPPETAIVVGVASEPLGGEVGWVRVATTVSGKTTTTSFDATELPHETRVTAPANDPSAPFRVDVTAFQGFPGSMTGPTAPALLERTAETAFLPGETRLLRMELQAACLPGVPGGPPGGPACGAPTTCIGGACASDIVAPLDLPPYTSSWASTTPDICKPANAGPAVVQLGTGQTDYLPLTAGQTVQMEAGPQGGHHIWIATRQQNLSQMGTVTTITSTQPGTGLAGPRMAFVFTFEQDQGGFCKLYGMRYQVDVDGADYHQFLGKPLDLTISLKDPSGATGVGHAQVNIDPMLLCPSTATTCN